MVVCILLGLLVTSVHATQAATIETSVDTLSVASEVYAVGESAPLRVLLIGNSFSRDSAFYLSKLASVVGCDIEAAYAQFVGFEDIDPIEKGGLLVWTSEVTAPLTEANVSYVVDVCAADPEYPGEWYFDTEGVPSKDYSKTVFVCAKFTDADGN